MLSEASQRSSVFPCRVPPPHQDRHRYNRLPIPFHPGSALPRGRRWPRVTGLATYLSGYFLLQTFDAFCAPHAIKRLGSISVEPPRSPQNPAFSRLQRLPLKAFRLSCPCRLEYYGLVFTVATVASWATACPGIGGITTTSFNSARRYSYCSTTRCHAHDRNTRKCDLP